MHVHHVKILISHVKMQVTENILIFVHVVIFHIENNTEKTYSKIETGMVRAKLQEGGIECIKTVGNLILKISKALIKFI